MSGIDKDCAATLRKVLDRLLTTECQSCRKVGDYQLEDEIRERRSWKITAEGVNREEERNQEDSEPYFVSCRECGHPLGPLELGSDDLQVLIDAKDSQ